MKWNKVFLISTAFVVIVMGLLQIPNRTRLADPDGFYHAKVSQLLQHGQLHDNFPYLIYTTWRDGFADQHFLYHALLIPFNNISHLYLSIIFFSTLAFCCFYLFLSKLGVKQKLFWVFIALLGSTDFLFRINLVKANTLSLVLLFLLMLALWNWQEKRNKLAIMAAGAISFLFVWTYGGFVFIPVVLGLYALAILILKRQIVIAPVLACAAGIILGILLHPHHANLLASLYNQIFLTGLGAGKAVPAGNEWLPYNVDWFISSDVPVLLIWILGFLISIYNAFEKKLSWLNLWTQLLALVLVALALDHRRFIEYFVPFAVLASAVSLSPYLSKVKWSDIKLNLKNWQMSVSFLVVIVVIAGFSAYNFRNVYKDLQNGESIYKYQAAAAAIKSVSQPGDIVINTQWDEFPQLFYWDDTNYYPVGMDPTFMYIYNQDLYWGWRKVADQDQSGWDSPKQLRDLLVNDLRAKFLFIDSNRNPDLPKYILDTDPGAKYFTSIYNAEGIQVFQLK